MKQCYGSFLVCFLLYLCSYLSMLTSFRLSPKCALKPTARMLLSRAVRNLSPAADNKFEATNSASHSASTSHTMPIRLKTMLFMDGTWLYYSIVNGRLDARNCPLAQKFGPYWRTTHHVEWDRLPQLIARNLTAQLADRKLISSTPVLDITRCNVFTSMRADTDPNSPRVKMLSNFYKNNFAVHRYENAASGEKCVDISLAVEMLYLATVPNAYEIACIVTGDKDFIPALQKTRMLGKRVAICSMRNSCNADLIAQEAQLRDFDVIWLDDHLDEIIVPKACKSIDVTAELLDASIQALTRLQASSTGVVTAREFGRELQTLRVNNADALSALKQQSWSVRTFIGHFSGLFKVLEIDGSVAADFGIELRDGYETYLERYREKASLSGDGGDVSESTGGEAVARYAYLNTILDTVTFNNSGSTIGKFNNTPSSTSSSNKSLLRNNSKGPNSDHATKTLLGRELVNIMLEYYRVHQVDTISSRDLGRYLKSVPYSEHTSALAALRKTFGSVSTFLKRYTRVFRVENYPPGTQEGSLVHCNSKVGRQGEMDQPTEGEGEFNSDGKDGKGGDTDSGTGGDTDSDGGASSESNPVAAPVAADVEVANAVKKYKVAELRAQLEQRGLSSSGKKDELVARLVEAMVEETI